MTPHSKPHKWIAHFLHVFTKYQWVNTAQGATDRELQSINCCCSSSRGRLSPQKQVELFGIFNPDEDHEPACDKKGWHKQTKKSHWQLEKSKKKTRLLVVLNSAIEAKNLEMENKKKIWQGKGHVMIQDFRNLCPKKQDHLWWKETPSKETEGVYRTAHKLSFQLNPVEDGSANSFSRTHRVGQALIGPKRFSKTIRKLIKLGELVSMTWHKHHKQECCQINLEFHMQDIPDKLFTKIENSGVYQQWFFSVTTIIPFLW